VSYEDRINECLKADSTKIEFEIVGTDQKGFSHNVKLDCLLNSSLPKFKIKDMKGNLISDEKIKGKINVIHFWFIKCKPCRAEIPTINTLVEKYKTDEVNFLALTRDQPEDLRLFLEKRPFNFTIIPNAANVNQDKFHLMWGYPLTIITDKKNKIIATISAGTPETNLASIEAILNKTLSNQ
jgi:peroxiredoxin